jgi:hypothetical protein
MSIENIDSLIEFLTNLRKQVDNKGILNPIERDILKKEILDFYQKTYLIPNNNIIEKSETTSNVIISSSIDNVNANESIIEPIQEVEKEAFLVNEPSIQIDINNEEQTESKEILIPKTIEPIIIDATIPSIDVSKIEVAKENIFIENKNPNLSEPVLNEQIGLNDKLNSNNNSLNDKFQSNTSISDRYSAKNKSINEMIDLNKRLLFVDVLFKGNSQLFNQVIQHIDEYKTAEEAIKFLEFNKEKLDLNEKKESVYNSLIDLINKKFI